MGVTDIYDFLFIGQSYSKEKKSGQIHKTPVLLRRQKNSCCIPDLNISSFLTCMIPLTCKNEGTKRGQVPTSISTKRSLKHNYIDMLSLNNLNNASRVAA